MLVMNDYFGKDSFYSGVHGEWYVLFDYSRDSSLLDNANLLYIKRKFGIEGKKDEEFPRDIKIERASHGAVGWIEYILINPYNPEFVKIGEDIEQRLEDYPVLSDDIYSDLQYEAYGKYLAEAREDYRNRYDREFDIELYEESCYNVAMDHKGYISVYDLEQIEGIE